MPQLTNEIIDAAIAGYEQQRARIAQKIEELLAMRTGNHSKAGTIAGARTGRRKRRLSAEARARIAAAQRARWAKAKGESQPSTPAAAPKRKRRLSKEGRERIIAATKARWARVKAEKAKPARKRAGSKKARTIAAPATA